MSRKPSKRFIPSNIIEKLVPILLLVILLGLLAVLLVTGLALFGITPGA
jgi:hypothetical protein